MSHEGEASTSRGGEPRVPFDGAVRLRYRLFQQFLEENAANISTGGMFIRTIHPGEPGSELDFEIRLEDDFTLIQGHGEVVWVKRQGPGPGMGIRFLELPDESRALVDKIVAERTAAGLELFDLENAAAEETAAEAEPSDVGRAKVGGPVGDEPVRGPGGGESASDTPEAPPVEEAPEEPAAPASPAAFAPEVPPSAPAISSSAEIPAAARRSILLHLAALAVISALVGAAAVLTFYWLHVQPAIEALEMRIEELAGDPGGPWRPPAEEPEPAAAEAADAEAGEGATTATAASESDEVVEALRAWATAWTEQRAEDHLSYYAADFQPPDGLDRAAWEEARRARIARPRWIRVALTLVQVEATGPDGAEVRFVQSYRSERYRDLVRKRMTMVREDGAWKIAAEQSTPG